MSTQTMSAESAADPAPRRLALVVAGYSAVLGAPPGIDGSAFAASCLADTYEVLADLVGIASGVVGEDDELADLLWPGAVRMAPAPDLYALASQLAESADELILLPADVPDLPGLVVAKVFKALQRADLCLAPERGGEGCVALGVRLPWPDWVPTDLDLNAASLQRLRQVAPRSGAFALGPDWHRLRSPAALRRLDPGLEGWEATRALLSGRSLSDARAPSAGPQ